METFSGAPTFRGRVTEPQAINGKRKKIASLQEEPLLSYLIPSGVISLKCTQMISTKCIHQQIRISLAYSMLKYGF